jgi:HEAT repeat protein
VRAEEAELAIGKIAVAVQRAGSAEQKLRLFAQQLGERPPADQALLMHTIGARAVEDPGCGQLLLVLGDVNSLRAALGPEKLEQLRQGLGGHAQGAVVERYLRALAGVEPERVALFRAKTGVTLQAVSTLNLRLESQRLPQLRTNGYEIAERVLSESGLADARVRVELGELSPPALAVARDVLLDADFAEVDDDRFETTVTDDQLRTLGQGAGLGRVLGRGGAAALPEAVAQRQAILIIARFCLLCRSATMYPPEHPSLPPAFEAFRSMIEQAIEDREQITLTVLTGDVLLDDVKVRKEDRFKKTFVDLFDERQVASVTFRSGLTPDEVKALVYCFTDSAKRIKDAGGVRVILARRNVTNILIDQFRYRVVSDDGTTPTEAYPGAPGDRLLESLVYSHVLERIERGGTGSIQALSVEEIGGFFKDLLSSPDEDKRRALARLLISLDPSLLERGFLANPELRQSLSWSAARKAIDLAFRDLAEEDHETREQALDTIAQFADLAIARQKDTTVALITRRLLDHLASREADPDLLRRGAAVFAAMASTHLKRRRLDKAAEIVGLLWQIARGEEAVSFGQDVPAIALRPAPAERDALRDAARQGLAAVGREEDAVDVLVQAVADPDSVRNQPAAAMLEVIETPVVVTKLFRLFLDQDRSVRSRAYRLLRKIGPRGLGLLRHEIEERRLPTHPGREPVTGVFQADSEWYILRNCLGLVAEIEPDAAGPLFKELAADPDHRVRRECLRLITRHTLPGGADTLRSALADPQPEVREAAIAGVGPLRDEEAAGPLIELLYRHPEHRKIALEALGHIGSLRCVDFLLTALDALDARARRRRRRVRLMPDFPADREAILQAISTVGGIGGAEVAARLEQFLASWSSPLRRWSLRPGGRTLAPQEFLGAVENALALARRKIRQTPPAPEAAPSPPPELWPARRRK